MYIVKGKKKKAIDSFLENHKITITTSTCTVDGGKITHSRHNVRTTVSADGMRVTVHVHRVSGTYGEDPPSVEGVG